MDDFVENIQKDMKRLNYNMFRFYNEPDSWWDSIIKDIETWLQTETDLFVKHFASKTKWYPRSVARSQYPELVNSQPIFMQWTLTNFGQNIELAVKKLTPDQAKKFKLI